MHLRAQLPSRNQEGDLRAQRCCGYVPDEPSVHLDEQELCPEECIRLCLENCAKVSRQGNRGNGAWQFAQRRPQGEGAFRGPLRAVLSLQNAGCSLGYRKCGLEFFSFIMGPNMGEGMPATDRVEAQCFSIKEVQMAGTVALSLLSIILRAWLSY